MQPLIIDSLYSAASGFVDPALEAFAGKESPEEWAEINALSALLEPLDLPSDILNEIEGKALDIFASGSQFGFRRGFRTGMRLMEEYMAETDGQRTGGNS